MLEIPNTSTETKKGYPQIKDSKKKRPKEEQ